MAPTVKKTATKTVKKVTSKPKSTTSKKTVKKTASKATVKNTTSKKTSGQIIKDTNKLLKRNKIIGFTGLALTALGGLGYLVYQNKDKIFKSKTKDAVTVINKITPNVSKTEIIKIVNNAAKNNTPPSVVVNQIQQQSEIPLTKVEKIIITESINNIPPPPPPQPQAGSVRTVKVLIKPPPVPTSQAPILKPRQLTTGQIQEQPSITSIPEPPPVSIKSNFSSPTSPRASLLDSILGSSPTTLKKTTQNAPQKYEEQSTTSLKNVFKNRDIINEDTISEEDIMFFANQCKDDKFLKKCVEKYNSKKFIIDEKLLDEILRAIDFL